MRTVPLSIPGFLGDVLTPDDEAYATAKRIWNGMIDRRPAAIARCTAAADVAAAIRFGRDRGLPIAIRAGGHNVTGNALCDDGLVVDLTRMKGIDVSAESRRVSVEAGVTWGEFYHETQRHGLATTGGIVTDTGVAGLTLGGGIGWLMRRHGATCDNLLSAEVVTAGGELLRASETEHPDLFWALRGGGGNFGVVTSFDFQLHALGPEVLAGSTLYDAAGAGGVLRAYRDVAARAPDEIATIVGLRRVPPLPIFPGELHGRAVVAVNMCYLGAVDRAEQALAPLRALGPVLVDRVRPMPYELLQSIFDSSVPWGFRYYWKTHYLPALDDATIHVLIDHAWRLPSQWSYSLLFHLGGALSRVPADETAFNGRDVPFAINLNGVGVAPGEDAEIIEWTRSYFRSLEPHATGGAYLNFLGEEGTTDDRLRRAYRVDQLARLRAAKTAYDPDNVFRFNHNIPPAA